jgi:hypothetical protein
MLLQKVQQGRIGAPGDDRQHDGRNPGLIETAAGSDGRLLVLDDPGRKSDVGSGFLQGAPYLLEQRGAVLATFFEGMEDGSQAKTGFDRIHLTEPPDADWA